MAGTLIPLLSARVTVDAAVDPTPFFETATVKAYTVSPVKVPNGTNKSNQGYGY